MKNSLSKLALRLRVLNAAEKRTYLTELDEHAKDHYMQMSSGQLVNPFSLQSLAFSIYYSLEGTPYTQPEFSSQTTMKDVKAKEKFNTLFAGIVSYTKASDAEKENFRKSVLKKTSLCKKVIHLMKIRQNGMV